MIQFSHTVSHLSPIQDASQPFRTLRPNLTRVRTGCLTCRTRKKKCDEKKPRCTGCARNHLTCAWPKHVSVNNKDEAHASLPSPPSSLSSPSSSQHSEHGLCGSQQVTVSPGGIDMTESITKWNALSVSYIGQHRPCFLTSASPILIQHYMDQTVSLLPAAAPLQNPFISNVIPLACNDDLLMHTVLCTSAAHLSFKQDYKNMDMEKATWSHYSLVIQGLRNEFGDLQLDNIDRILRLTLVLIVLCHFEGISGDITGTIFRHLRACRELVVWLLDQQHHISGDNRTTLGFILELYAYIVLVNNIGPYGMIEQRMIPFEPFMLSLDSLHGYKTFGTMFAGAHALFQLIPRICLLFQQRLAEEESGMIIASEECLQIQKSVLDTLQKWELPEDSTPSSDRQHQLKFAEVWRLGLHILLAVSMEGSVITNPKVICELQELLDNLSQIISTIMDVNYSTTFLWIGLIAGSCLTRKPQQKELLDTLSYSRYSFRIMLRACELLQLLWNDSDPRAFGPYGLYFVMKKHGISLCVM